jgi:metal-dependent hydrolase (beta-lactamase superfamily II)
MRTCRRREYRADAQRLTAVPRLHALLGGLHLSGGYFAPNIAPTVEALTAMAPDLLVPGHCTGWQAQHTFAAALPGSWVRVVVKRSKIAPFTGRFPWWS